MVLNLLNLYTLIFALFGKISSMTEELQNLKPNTTAVTPVNADCSTPLSRTTPVTTTLPAITGSSGVITTLTPDITTTVMLIATTLSAAPHLIANVTSLIQSIATEESAEMTSVTSELASLFNFTASASGASGLPTLSTIFNATELYIHDKTDNTSSQISDTGVMANKPTFSIDLNDTGDYFTNAYMEDSLSDNLTSIDEQINTSLPINFTETEDGLFNSTDGYLDIINSYYTDDSDMTSNVTVLNMKSTAFEVSEADLDSNSRLLSLEQYLDNTSSNFTDNFVSTESIPPLNNVSVANSTFDEDSKSHGLTSVMEREELSSVVITTLETILAQSKDFVSTSQYIEHISQTIQKTTTDNTLPTDGTASSWEPSSVPDAICEKHSTAVTTETSSTLEESHGSSNVQVDPSQSSPAQLDMKTREKLRRLCWETMFGQELVKLTVMDLVVTVSSTLIIDFIRAVFVRVMNNCWCWDLEKQFPQYGDFKIAENILHLVNNQGMVWMGMFFSPGLPLLNLIKLVILMYLRSWAVLTCNVPHEVVFRASRSNNFYFALLLTMLFLCVLPVGYAIVWVEPSWHCGPFSDYKHIYHIFTKSLQKAVPQSLHRALDYIASPGTVIPLLLLLVLVIYYLLSLTGALREANNDLKTQLRRERTEERRKMFQLVHRRRRGGSGADVSDTPYSRWRKILPVMPSKSLPGESGKECEVNTDDKDSVMAVRNGDLKNDCNQTEFLTRIIRQALRKSSATSDEESMPVMDGEGTDNEAHDSLSEDRPQAKAVKVRPRFESNSSGIAETSYNAEQAPVIKSTAEKTGEKNHHRHHHHNHHQLNHRRRSEQRHKSPSSSSNNKERDDSLTSAWSDNIPVIRISKTDSSECIQQRAQPQQPIKSSSSDTVIEPVHKSTKAVPSPTAHQKSDTKFRGDQLARDSVQIDTNGHKRLVRALISESKRRKTHKSKEGQKLGDEMEMAQGITQQEQGVRKDEAKMSPEML